MRVVAGQLRGRRLHTLGRAGGGRTRPTTDRAREGLFAWVGSRVEGATVLDLFAGTGSLGIEALSRGAERATFVERARPAAALLRRNLGELGLAGRARVLARDVRAGLSVLKREEVRFDLIFADPPYARPHTRDWAAWLVREAGLEQLLANGGVLLVERAVEARTPDPVGPIELQSSKSYGGTSFDRYERKGTAGE